MENKNKWYHYVWDGLKWFGWEVVRMFSNEDSFLSAKRCERFAMFSIAMVIIMGYVQKNWGTLSTEDIMFICGMLLAGGAWNAVQIRKDLKELDKSKTDAKEE